MRATGPGTPYTGFGDERRPQRTQDEIRADLADRANIVAERREARIATLAPVMGAAAVGVTVELVQGIGEQAGPAEQAARFGAAAVAAQAEIA